MHIMTPGVTTPVPIRLNTETGANRAREQISKFMTRPDLAKETASKTESDSKIISRAAPVAGAVAEKLRAHCYPLSVAQPPELAHPYEDALACTFKRLVMGGEKSGWEVKGGGVLLALCFFAGEAGTLEYLDTDGVAVACTDVKKAHPGITQLARIPSAPLELANELADALRRYSPGAGMRDKPYKDARTLPLSDGKTKWFEVVLGGLTLAECYAATDLLGVDFLDADGVGNICTGLKMKHAELAYVANKSERIAGDIAGNLARKGPWRDAQVVKFLEVGKSGFKVVDQTKGGKSVELAKVYYDRAAKAMQIDCMNEHYALTACEDARQMHHKYAPKIAYFGGITGL